MQIACLFCGFCHIAFEVRDHPIHGIIVGMHLLIIIAGDQQRSRGSRHVQLGGCQPLPRPCIGEVEVQPEQTVLRQRNRLVDRQRFSTAIRQGAKCPDQSGDRGRQFRGPARLRIQQDAGNWCFSLHGTPYNI